MKLMIEIKGGALVCVTATEECSIYLVDHDDLEERGWDPKEDKLEVMQPDCITGELHSDCNDETPEFDRLLNEALEEYTG